MSERSASRILISFAALAACLIAGFSAGWAMPHDDGLEPLPNLDYTNVYTDEEFSIACTHRGSRADLEADGSDVGPGDRMVRDCKVVALP